MKSAGSTDPQGYAIGSASGGGAYGTQGYTAQFGQPDNFDPTAHPHNSPRRRMQQEEESSAGDADDNDWTVTYTDMVTLLMAFFVMLITLTIIEKKETPENTTEQPGEASPYRPTPANGATLSISPFDGHGITMLEGGRPVDLDPNEDQNYDTETRPTSTRYPTITITPRPTPLPTPSPAAQQDPATPNANTALAQRLRAMVQQNNLGGQVQVVSNEASVTVRISDRILFQSGKADLEGAGKDLISRLLPMLNQPGQILSVEGHTDNIPISTALYPSNWELSASRAATVVRQLIDLGLPPNRLRAIAYADTKPVSSNASADTRASNRRVELVITSETAPTQP